MSMSLRAAITSSAWPASSLHSTIASASRAGSRRPVVGRGTCPSVRTSPSACEDAESATGPGCRPCPRSASSMSGRGPAICALTWPAPSTWGSLGLVDATVVALAERIKLSSLATTDRRHFSGDAAELRLRCLGVSAVRGAFASRRGHRGGACLPAHSGPSGAADRSACRLPRPFATEGLRCCRVGGVGDRCVP